MQKIDENQLDWDDSAMPSYQGKPFTGIAVLRDIAGVTRSEQCFVNGVQEGYFKRYDWNGNPLEEGFYCNNQKHGLWLKYINDKKQASLWNMGDWVAVTSFPDK